jgi:hypothetical protein
MLKNLSHAFFVLEPLDVAVVSQRSNPVIMSPPILIFTLLEPMHVYHIRASHKLTINAG